MRQYAPPQPHRRSPVRRPEQVEGPSGMPPSPSALLALQRAAGNRAVGELVHDRTQALPLQRHAARSSSRPAGETTTGTEEQEGLGTTSAGGAGPTRPAGGLGSRLRALGSALRSSSAVRKAEIYGRLALTSQGRHALWILTRYRVSVEVNGTEPGCYFAPSENKIYLNENETAPSAAIILVHEAGHAETYHRTGDPDVMSLSRDAYVRTLIEDEARAVVRQILVIGEFQRIRFNTTNTSVGAAQIQRYWQAHNDAAEALGPDASAADKERAGRDAGYQEVYDMFFDGTFVTSTTGESYADYYGSFWDQARAAAAGGGGG